MLKNKFNSTRLIISIISFSFLFIFLHPSIINAADLILNNTPAQIYFSPSGGCTKAIVKEISNAKSEILVQFVEENKMKVQWVESRIIPHIQEMGNVGCHYKGPKITLQGWQFSLDRKMVDVNILTLNTRGYLKVHGDLPLNKGFISPAPRGFDFGY